MTIDWLAMSFWERLCFIVDHGDEIFVRAQIDGHWDSVELMTLPDDQLRDELYRLAKRDVQPTRLVRPVAVLVEKPHGRT